MNVRSRLKYTVLLPAALAVVASCDVPLQEQYPLESQFSLPEGVAYDPLSRSFFATAINGGQITRISALGQEHVFYASQDPNASFGGAHVDAVRRLLWVCQVDVKTDAIPNSKVVAFDDDGELVKTIDLGEPSFCNDLVTDKYGAVYATDSALPVIYKIDPKTQTKTVFASHPQWAPVQPGMVGLNGLDITPDGKALYVVTTIPAAMYRVDLANPSNTAQVTFSGDPFSVPGDPRFPGPDGLEFVDGEAYVVYDGGVQQLHFTGPTQATVKTTTAVPTGLTSAVDAEDRLYVIDSEVFRVLYMNQPPELPFAILHVDTAVFDAQ